MPTLFITTVTLYYFFLFFFKFNIWVGERKEKQMGRECRSVAIQQISANKLNIPVTSLQLLWLV